MLAKQKVVHKILRLIQRRHCMKTWNSVEILNSEAFQDVLMDGNDSGYILRESIIFQTRDE
jgi:hypothetical protein